MDNAHLISLVIPVYKVEKYLHKCVDSILAQTYKNLEIILVDDGSPDNCGKICDEYAAKDSRIKVIHQPNGGLSVARNAGLDIATGDYIGFVDSDDYIAPEMFEKLYFALTENSADISICNYDYVDSLYQTMNVYSPVENRLYNSAEIIECLFSEYYCYFVTVWNRLYKAEVFSRLRFEEGKKFEDAFIAHHIFLECRKIVTIRDKLYYYLQRNDSIMGSKLSVSKCDELEAMFIRNGDLKKCGIIIDYEKANRQFIDTYKFFKKNFLPKTKEEKNRVKVIDGYAKQVYKQSKQICSFREHIIFSVIPYYHFIANIKWKLANYIFLISLFIKQSLSKYILINLPIYGNLGDQAIAVAEMQFFKKLGFRVIEVNENIVEDDRNRFYKHIRKNKAIIICGGGFSGCLWRTEEQRYIRKPLRFLPNNRIIVFPQTVTFDLDSESCRKFFEESKRLYSAHCDLTFFVREKSSYCFMIQNMPDVKTIIAPDIVMALDVPEYNSERTYIAFCLRTDKERMINCEDDLKRNILQKYPNYEITYVDNLVNRCIYSKDRKTEVYAQLEKFSKAKLVITDRLHGMIFAAITATPCIAFDNSNGKVGGVYDEWLKDNEYVKFCKTEDDFKKALAELDLEKEYVFNNRKIKEGFKALEEVLNG